MENASSCLDRDLGLSQETLIHFGLAAESRCFVLLSSSGDKIAVINESTGQILKKLLELETARMSAYLTVQAWSERHSSGGTNSKKTYLLVNLNIYGSSAIRDQVSKVLSLSHVYLQHPIYQKYSTSYDNPHFVEINGVIPDEDTLPDQSAMEVIEAQSGRSSLGSSRLVNSTKAIESIGSTLLHQDFFVRVCDFSRFLYPAKF